MKYTKCKRCDAPDLYWTQGLNGKWLLRNSIDDSQHHCDDGKIKAIKCKYCNAADLYWAEEMNTGTQQKKMILTESYGLPHACDERLAAIAKDKKDKKDKYDAYKQQINAIPNGVCTTCKGTGYCNTNQIAPLGTQGGVFGLCSTCRGHAKFNEHTKKIMLATERRKIWPNMQDNSYGGRRYPNY